MKKIKTERVAEIVVNIAFYLEDWETLKLFLEAFRFPNLLGPLENLQQLHRLGWDWYALWPCLDLREMDDSSLGFVLGIAKYFSKVRVDDKIDIEWFSRYFDPKASIKYFGPNICPNALVQWKRFRITKVNRWNWEMSKFVESLSYLNYLETLTNYGCTAEIASTIFKFAATSLSLRNLSVTSDCTMLTSMANDLLHWIKSQPIQELRLGSFTWSNTSLRESVISAALRNTAFEYIYISETSLNGIAMTAQYTRKEKLLELSLYRRGGIVRDGLDDVHHFISPFFVLLFYKCGQTFCLDMSLNDEFKRVWNVLAPLIEQSKLKQLDLFSIHFETEDAKRLAKLIHQHQTLEKLHLLKCDSVGFDWMKLFLQSVPRTTRKMSIEMEKPTAEQKFIPSQY
ncbi:hypothetical protein AeMF1_012968 [Aphanomyces euteiches]|nr:hypothetical protein AeMF1_012968 [Aphanomyces euteiches]KAH9182065.1 hypothetical protein AeNC1_015960 [Aphanomyces euteiches]